jgi:fibro-slime domain-containing protein
LINQAGEACDDGNTVGGDGCTAMCDQVEDGWLCPTPGQPCVNTTQCGDKRVSGGETCDDGNTADGDGCSSTCQLETGYFCPVVGALCRVACGDGLVLGNEPCDDGNTADGDGCNSRCQLDPGYVCDAAGVCRQTVCGDGAKEGSEQCDDTAAGATDLPFDGCFHCLLEPDCSAGSCKSACGDGQRFSDEGCDDGNLWSGDGCSADCKVETGFSCADTPASTLPETKDIPVVVRDFIGLGREFNPSSSNGHYHVDFNRHYGNGNGIFAMIKPTLAADGRPIWRWLPYTLTLTLTDVASGTYSNVKSTSATAFDPIPKSGWIATGDETDSGCAGAGAANVSFTTETHFWFEYQGGEQFAFSGDDDTWVFIKQTLVVDWGGLHGKVDGSFTLDMSNGSAVSVNAGQYYDGQSYSWTQGGNVQLGLVPGQIYEVAMFQAERNQCGSNFGVTLKNFSKPKSICASVCGDGIVAADEYCDDGVNTSTYNGCGPGCIPAPCCGDGLVQSPPEECDDGVNTSQYGGCAPGCTRGPFCGDGKVQAQWGEQCDDGVNAGGYGKCGPGCQYGERCGDGKVQPEYEACDEGANNGHGTCLQNCQLDWIP